LTGAWGTGLRVEQSWQINRIGALAWKIYGGLLGLQSINKLTLKIFDKTVWLWRRIDRLMPWPGLTLIMLARKRAR
jgi:hypothetical protein